MGKIRVLKYAHYAANAGEQKSFGELKFACYLDIVMSLLLYNFSFQFQKLHKPEI